MIIQHVIDPFTGSVLFAPQELTNSPRDPQDDGFYAREALEAMALLRVAVRRPMVNNSGPRSLAHNTAIGGKPGSYHLYEGDGHELGCCAWDISTTVWSQAEIDRLVITAWQLGWSVGVANTFVHVDCRSLVYQRRQAWWTYKGYSGRDYSDSVFSMPRVKS